ALEVLPQGGRILQGHSLSTCGARKGAARRARCVGRAPAGNRGRVRAHGEARRRSSAHRQLLSRTYRLAPRPGGDCSAPRCREGRQSVSKISISLTVNGEPRQVLAEPRDQLADLLRRELMLTG